MKSRIAIIVAMEDVEADYLKINLGSYKEEVYNGFKFLVGEIANKEVVICVSNIGLINAAIGTTITIEKYKPSIIINEGLAGGYTSDTKKGEIVVRKGCNKYYFIRV